MALAGGATLAGGNCILRSHPGPGVVTRAWQSVNAASKARRARFCVKPFRPRHHRLPRGPSREAVVSVCLMHPTKGFRPMTGSTVRMPSNLSRRCSALPHKPTWEFGDAKAMSIGIGIVVDRMALTARGLRRDPARLPSGWNGLCGGRSA